MDNMIKYEFDKGLFFGEDEKTLDADYRDLQLMTHINLFMIHLNHNIKYTCNNKKYGKLLNLTPSPLV